MTLSTHYRLLQERHPYIWIMCVSTLWILSYSLFLPQMNHLGGLFLPDGHLQESISFFLYEVPKVFLLLFAVVFVVGFLRTFVAPEKAKEWLKDRLPIWGHSLAALLGVITPFCSCSAVPLFVGFVQSGVPLGITFSFLIAAPMVNEVALVMLFSFFGLKVVLTYLVAGVSLSIICGYIIGILNLEHLLEDWVKDLRESQKFDQPQLSIPERFSAGADSVSDIIGRVWIYVIIGIAVGAGIHGYIPTGFFSKIMGANEWWSVPIAVILGVPMYSNAASIFPVAQVLLEKGAALGTTLAFMMSVMGYHFQRQSFLEKFLSSNS